MEEVFRYHKIRRSQRNLSERLRQKEPILLSIASLASLLTRETLRQMATDRSYSRGEQYAVEGRVKALEQDGERVVAEVIGTEEYHVELWAEDGDLYFDCDCPIGSDGEFCKHCVAVGIVWLNRCKHSGKLLGQSGHRGVTLDDVRDYLRTLSPEALIELLMNQVHEDAGFREEILLRVASSTRSGVNVETFRKALDRLVPTRYVDYASARSWSRDIARVLNSIEDLIQNGHGEEAMALIEYAVPRLDESIGQIDDSSGYVGGELARLPELYLSACDAARPDPVALAEQLFDWAISTECIDFVESMEAYQQVLGKEGQAAFLSLVQSEWDQLPVLGPGAKDDRYGKRFRVTRLMEAIARATGNVDALVGVKSHDLSHPYAFLQIALLYQKAGRHDDALEWAERGRAAFPVGTDGRLREFLIEEYHRRVRFEDEMAIVWLAFTESPTLRGYQYLETYASRIQKWPEWSERAWKLLRERVSNKKSTPPQRYDWSSAHAEIVRILLWEQRAEEAWSEAVNAPKRDISDNLWLQLADACAEIQPDDSLRIYRQQIHPLVEKTSNGDYDAPMELLMKCHDIMLRLGRDQEFLQYAGTLHDEFRRKRNFIKLLAGERWV